jgi:hypothetical protein
MYNFKYFSGIVSIIITLVIVFLPLYLVLMFPCVLIQIIRKEKSGENVVKKFFNIDEAGINGAGHTGHVDDEENKLEGMPLTNEHLKSKLNCRRASSIEGENEIEGRLKVNK